MKRTKRKFTSEFKAQVALEAIKERETISELSRRFDVHPNMITKWKQEFITKSKLIFEKDLPYQDSDSQIEMLYAKIGKLEVERDFLKKAYLKTGL
jgi:transposase